MEETKGNKFRTFSATAMVNASQKPRPGSSVLTAITAKKEIIETIYGVCPNLPTQPSRHSSVKQLRKIQQGN